MVKILDKLKNIFNKKAKTSNEDITAEHKIDDLLDNHDGDLKEQIKDEVEETVQESSLIKFLRTQLPFLYNLINKKKEKVELSSTEESELVEKPKRKIKVIHIIFILGAAFFMFGEEILGTLEEEKKLDPVAKIKKRIKKRKKLNKKPKVVDSKGLEEKSDKKDIIKNDSASEVDPLMIGVEEKKETEVAKAINEEGNQSSGEDITDLFKEKMEAKPDDISENLNSNIIQETEQAIETNTETEKIVQDNIVVEDVNKLDSASKLEQIQKLNQQKAEKAKLELLKPIGDDQETEFLISDFESEEAAKSDLLKLEEKMKESGQEPNTSSELTSEYTFTDAPDYSYTGRGLVRNCIDGHWACVDVKSYSLCEKNYNYNKSQSKTIECYPKAIYDNDVDCEKIQLEYISNSEPTAFCE